MSTITKYDEESSVTPVTIQADSGQKIGNPAPMAMGNFATTLLTLSLALMGFRGVTTQTMFVGNLCLVAGVGLIISAQWGMVNGDTFTYTVLSSFGLFYAAYGAMIAPNMGIVASYGGLTPEYYNAMGFFLLLWAVFDIFFIIASLTTNFVYILIFITVELCLALDAAASFAKADGKDAQSVNLATGAGVFGLLASLLGYYCVLYYLCQDSLPFRVPMGDTSRFFKRMRAKKEMLN